MKIDSVNLKPEAILRITLKMYNTYNNVLFNEDIDYLLLHNKYKNMAV